MYPNGTVPTGPGRYMEDERHSTRRLGKMKSKMIMASLLAILMVVTVVPMTFSEDSDALTGDSNISLNAQHVSLYTDSPAQSSFVFTVDLTHSTSQSTDVTWTTNAIGTPQATVQLSATTGNSITVTGTGAGTIEIVATVDSQNYASAVVAVQTGYAPATSFTFYIQVDPAVSNYYSNIIIPSNTSISALNAGITMTVTKAQVEARYGTGTTFNALNAFNCAIAAQNELIDQMEFDEGDEPVYWQANISSSGWFNSFLNLASYPGDNGSWIYWAQYHAVQNGNTTEWAFNNYGFYDIATEDYSTLGLIFWASPATMDVPDYPFIVPTP